MTKEWIIVLVLTGAFACFCWALSLRRKKREERERTARVEAARARAKYREEHPAMLRLFTEAGIPLASIPLSKQQADHSPGCAVHAGPSGRYPCTCAGEALAVSRAMSPRVFETPPPANSQLSDLLLMATTMSSPAPAPKDFYETPGATDPNEARGWKPAPAPAAEDWQDYSTSLPNRQEAAPEPAPAAPASDSWSAPAPAPAPSSWSSDSSSSGSSWSSDSSSGSSWSSSDSGSSFSSGSD